MNYKLHSKNSFSPALAWLMLLTSLLISMSVFAEEQNLLEKLSDTANAYAKNLAQDVGAGYSQSERVELGITADMLLQHNRCDAALSLAKQAVSGLSEVTASDWLRIGQAAACARSWCIDTVPAAWLGAQEIFTANTNSDALILLGTALENCPQYGNNYALEAYKKSLEYAASRTIENKVRTLENILASEKILRLDHYFVQQDADNPALCLYFSNAMPEPAEQSYADFIRFDPPFKANFRKVEADQICADGATFGTHYQISILPGIAASNGAKISKLLQYQLYAGDRKSKLWFSNSRYVLPLGGGVPVHGVNVAKAKLTLYKIVERNLLQEEVRNMFRTDLNTSQTDRIRDELGEQIWQGEADLSLAHNQETITNLPIADYTPQKPGIYVLTAIPSGVNNTSSSESDEKASIWLLVSDIGITSYQGDDGLTLVTRSLATGEPLNGVRLNLYARNNASLGETVSDINGLAKIPVAAIKGTAGREPMMLMASGLGTDFNFLDISVAPYDLSDRGVAGRVTPGPVDAFLYTERGVYRPGEKVQLAALLRDDQGRAVSANLPLTLRFLRPDNQTVKEQVVNSQGAGGYSLNFALSPSARAGHWKIQAFLDPKATSVGEVEFQVEDIVPPKIEVNVDAKPTSPLKPGDSSLLTIQALYLFGAPGADLAATGEMRISADPDPFPALVGYRFGLVDEVDDSTVTTLDETRTNDTGHAQFPLKISELPKLERPLQANLRAEVVDVDGRAVATSLTVPVRQKPLYIGIKAPGDSGQIQAGTEANFQVVAVDPIGKTIPIAGLNYHLVEEQTDYQWYRENGLWQFKRQVRDRTIQDGQLTLIPETPASVKIPTITGSYRIDVTDSATGVISSSRVEVGWGEGSANMDTPDKLKLRSDHKDYHPGDVAKLTIQTPFIGAASLALATNRVLSIKNFELNGLEQTIEVPITADWGGGVYALVTAYRADAKTAGHGPRRAVGLVWLGLAQNLHQIPLDIEAPATVVRSRQTVELKVHTANFDVNDPVYITLAAVDEGVLRLTDYKNPDPLGYYFGQRTLGVGLKDLYGRLIDGHEGTLGTIRAGGDEANRRGAPDPHVQIISLFSGIVPLDKNGWAKVPFTLPDFNGRLRLVAVAWSNERVGAANLPLTVRDPVVLAPSVPRFLAIGDQSQASLLINNVEGSTGNYRLSWHTSGAIDQGNQATETILPLATGEHKLITIPLLANSVGNGSIVINLTTPEGETLKHEAQIGVRAAFLPESQSFFGRLRIGESANIGPYLIKGLLPETVTAQLSISTAPDLDVLGLLRQLDLYPHGCLEQVTSRAFPLLHIERLGKRWGYNSATPVAQRITDAVTQLLEKQQESGGFGLWGAYSNEEPWLSAYAMDFLQQAKASGFEVPDFLWNRGLEWLRRQVVTPENQDPQVIAVQAYATYLLARNGEAPEETARYLLDQVAEHLPSNLAAAHLGATFVITGDKERASKAFTLARKLSRVEALHDYGSQLRDLAAVVSIMHEYGQPDQMPMIRTIAQNLITNQWLSTQEQAWVIQAANTLTDESAPLTMQIQGINVPEQQTPITRNIPVATLATGLNLANMGKTPVWYSLAVSGSPMRAPPPLTQNMYIQRKLLGLDGNPVDPEAITQGSVLVVLLEGNATTNASINHQVLIQDPLPAGLEIENSNLANAAKASNLEWLGELTSTNYSAALDDRFVAALDIKGSTRNFKLAYLARAVTPGRYQAPPSLIEDMYRPNYRARGDSGWFNVVAPK